jgi:hypothetical protein
MEAQKVKERGIKWRKIEDEDLKNRRENGNLGPTQSALNDLGSRPQKVVVTLAKE